MPFYNHNGGPGHTPKKQGISSTLADFFFNHNTCPPPDYVASSPARLIFSAAALRTPTVNHSQLERSSLQLHGIRNANALPIRQKQLRVSWWQRIYSAWPPMNSYTMWWAAHCCRTLGDANRRGTLSRVPSRGAVRAGPLRLGRDRPKPWRKSLAPKKKNPWHRGSPSTSQSTRARRQIGVCGRT